MALTARDLASTALPYVRTAVEHERSNVKAQVGTFAWLFLSPVWAIVTGPLLSLIVRIGVEIALGLAADKAIPILKAIISFVEGLGEAYFPKVNKQFLEDLLALLQTPKSQFTQGAQYALHGMGDGSDEHAG